MTSSFQTIEVPLLFFPRLVDFLPNPTKPKLVVVIVNLPVHHLQLSTFERLEYYLTASSVEYHSIRLSKNILVFVIVVEAEFLPEYH